MEAAPEDGTEAIDDLRGEVGEVGEGFLQMRGPSRQASRSRMAGLLARLGMILITKDTGRYCGSKLPDTSPSERKTFDFKRLSANRPMFRLAVVNRCQQA